MQKAERKTGRGLATSRRSFLKGAATSSLLASNVAADQRARRRASLPGVKALRTRGSIAAHSNRLQVASAAGFSVGDSIIVELGGEASGGTPGSPGVGGVWPALSYPTLDVMRADTSQAHNTFAYNVDTGTCYQWNYGGATKAWKPFPANWYWARAVPLALTAKITAISGGTLTLSASAQVSSTNAIVHFDNAPIVNAITLARQIAHENDVAFIWPAGSYALGARISIANMTGCRFSGQGQTRTTLFSPKGVICSALYVSEADRTEVSDLTFAGNVHLTEGFGLELINGAGTATSPPRIPWTVEFVNSSRCNAHDLLISHPFQAIATSYGVDCTFSRIKVTTDGLQCYVQWMIMFANSTNCHAFDCEVSSTWITKGFSCFASNQCGFTRPVARNAVFALNSTGECIIDSPKVVLTRDSILSALSIAEPGTPIFDINANIDQNRGKQGNAVLNMNVTQLGYLNGSNDSMIGVNISRGRNTVVRGGSFSAPDYAAPSKQYGAQAVNSDLGGVNTMVEGLMVRGRSRGDRGYANITVANGSVANCVAEAIDCASPSCAARGDRLSEPRLSWAPASHHGAQDR